MLRVFVACFSLSEKFDNGHRWIQRYIEVFTGNFG